MPLLVKLFFDGEQQLPKGTVANFQTAKEGLSHLMKNQNNNSFSEVVGIVHASGVAGVGSTVEGDTSWTLRFTLEPWRFLGGPLIEYPIDIHKQLPEAELKEMMGLINAYDILRLRVKVEQAAQNHRPNALLIDLLGKETADAEMETRAEDLQKPVTIADDFFGEFTLNRRLNWYETTAIWKFSNVRLDLSIDEGEDLEPLLAMARSLWETQDVWDKQVRDFAVNELIELKNGSWLGEGEEEVTPEEFNTRMTLTSITLNSGGWVEFWHDDGDLFWGHSIRVSGTLSEGPTDAGIEG